MPLLYSIIESPTHPRFSGLYEELGIEELQFTSTRKAIAELKRRPPDFVVAEFFYGYGNNYAGVNVSNLDVFLHSLQKYAPAARVIALADKTDIEHIDKLPETLAPQAVIRQPADGQQIQALLAGWFPPGGRV